MCQQFSLDFKIIDTYGKLGSLSRGLQNIIWLSSFPTKLWRFLRGMSERAARAAKKPELLLHDHSFSSINNPETVLEISAVPEYFGTIYISVSRKIKKVFHDRKKGQNVGRKTILFYFSQHADKNYIEILRNCWYFQNCLWIIYRRKTVVVRATIRVFWPHAPPVLTCLAGIATTSLEMSLAK